jgi:tetratricopeptide (TPR) repeat protein
VLNGKSSNLVKACGVVLVTAALIAAWPGAARAEDRATEQARQHYESGTRHYDLGHWDEAIADFEKAYELRPDPNFLYNLAQVYRRKGEIKRALDLYKNYMRKVPNGPLRDEVEEKISALQKQIDEAAAKPAVAPIEPAAAAPVPAPPGGVAVPGNEPPIQQTPVSPSPNPTPAQTLAPPTPVAAPAPTVVDVSSPSSSPGRGLRTAGIVSGSVGAASLVAGAIFGLRARSLSNKVADANTFNRSDDSAGQRAETLQWAFYGIGAGALVAGGVLYYLGWSSAQSAPSAVTLAPVVGPNLAGLSAMGVF